MDETCRKALDDARRELSGLMEERTDLDQRITKLSKAIDSLAALSDDPNVSAEMKAELFELELSETMGFTNAIRQIIGASLYGVSPSEVRDALVGKRIRSQGAFEHAHCDSQHTSAVGEAGRNSANDERQGRKGMEIAKPLTNAERLLPNCTESPDMLRLQILGGLVLA